MMPAVTKRTEPNTAPPVRFMGFSGTLMIFSDSRLITKKDPQEPRKIPSPKR
jgi:hypothetical protein